MARPFEACAEADLNKKRWRECTLGFRGSACTTAKWCNDARALMELEPPNDSKHQCWTRSIEESDMGMVLCNKA